MSHIWTVFLIISLFDIDLILISVTTVALTSTSVTMMYILSFGTAHPYRPSVAPYSCQLRLDFRIPQRNAVVPRFLVLLSIAFQVP